MWRRGTRVKERLEYGQQGSPGSGVKLCRNWVQRLDANLGERASSGMTGTPSPTRTGDVSSARVWSTWQRIAQHRARSRVLEGKTQRAVQKEKEKGENKNHKGKSKGKDKLDKAGEGAQPQVQHLDASATASTTAPTVGAQQGTQPSTTTTASTAPQGEAVRGEVVNLLKSMRTTPPRVLTVTEMMNNYNGILLDSGARTSFDNLVTRESGTMLYPQKCRQQLVRPSSGWRRTANLF